LDILRLSRTYRTARRLQQVVNVFLRHGFGGVIDQIHLGKYIPFFQRLRAFGKWPEPKALTMPERLRLAFEELGPSFIKLAQILSTRPDLITARFAEEFKKLQDEVPPFDAETARSIVEEEIGVPVDNVFLKFETEPVAAASIAQVHNAVLMDGSEVIVKVQRPGIREQIETDLEILHTVARLLERNIPESKFFNPSGIVGEFQRTVRKELNFTEEGRNCCRFRRNFKDTPGVYFPKLYPEFLTEKVIVLERIRGVRVDDIKEIERMGLDRVELARAGVSAYFKMVLEDGFFHADPHAGNIFVTKDGKICFMDFGIVGRVDSDLRSTLANTFLALMKKDYDQLIDQYVELGLVPEGADMAAFRTEFKADLVDLLEPLYGMTLREIDFAEYLEGLIQLALRHGLMIPPDLLLINKAMLILHDIGMNLDPNFDFVAASEPYVTRLVRERYHPRNVLERASREMDEFADLLVNTPKQGKALIRKMVKDDFHMKLTHMGLEHFIKDMDKSTNRLSFSMVISAILISSAIMHATGVGPTIYGMSVLGFLSFGFAAFLGIWLIISIFRSGRM